VSRDKAAEKLQVNIVEVGPRDGFQNIKDFIPTELKVDIIGRLCKTGLRKIQATSFVSPKAIPQMRDAAEVVSIVSKQYPNVGLFALVPNFRGAQAAAEAGLKEISPVLSLSESHNRANVGKSVDESVEEVRRIRKDLPHLKITQDIATVFGCPFEGKMETAPLLVLLEKLTNEGIDEFTLCDTIGVAFPRQVENVLKTVKSKFPKARFNIHIHDTRNMGILNSWVAVRNGVHAVQSTLGGLGGCPFAPGASGNTSTEDLVYVLEQEGFDTGVDFEALLDAAKFLRANVAGNYSGHQINITTASSCC
jgi:hydroxymethylglutaryl-CoA lyase